MEDNIKAIGKDIRTITSKIKILNKEKEEAETKMKTVMKAVVDEMAKKHMDSKRVGKSKNMFVMKFSKLQQASWSPEYYNWEKQSEALFAYLSKKSPLVWEKEITELLGKGNPKVKVALEGDKLLRDFQLNKEFMKKVLDLVWGEEE